MTTVLAACTTTVGTDFDEGKVSGIVKNRTTKQQLIERFGEPGETSIVSPTEEKWVYMYGTEGSRGKQGTLKTLEVILENDVVTSYSYKFEEFNVE